MSSWVLLRGLMREARHWGEFPRQLREIADAQEIVAVDFPGNGSLCSQKSPGSVAAMAEHVREQLRQRGLQPPYRVLALSLGAMAAVAWSERHPAEIERMVLLNTSMAPFNPFYQRLRPRNYVRLLTIMLFGSTAQREQLILRLTSALARPDEAVLLQQWRRYAEECPVSRANMLRQLLAAARFHAALTRPTVPVLLLSGKQDGLVDPLCSQTLAQRWQCALRVHPTAGHDLALDAGEWVAQQVGEWLRQIDTPDTEVAPYNQRPE